MNKASWMSDEGYRNAVAKGAFKRVDPMEPDMALTTVQRMGRGVVGLCAVVAVSVLLIAIVMTASYFGKTEPGTSELVRWTFPWIWETFKLGCYVIAQAIAIFIIVAICWLGVMLVWEQLVAFGGWLLKPSVAHSHRAKHVGSDHR